MLQQSDRRKEVSTSRLSPDEIETQLESSKSGVEEVCDSGCPGGEPSVGNTMSVRASGPEIVQLSPEQDEVVQLDGTEVGNGLVVIAPATVNLVDGIEADSLTAVASKYALVNIRNSTRSVVVFEFKWGTGVWRTRSMDPGTSRNFWWTYSSGVTSSPTLYVRRGSAVYALRRYAADQVSVDEAAKYEFYSTGILRAIDGEVFPGIWSQVAWFGYGDWKVGMYVSGVRVERYMGPTNGYKWNYRVQIVGVMLSSGLPCVPGQHWEGLVRAKVSGSGGGYLDTGDMAVHSGGGTKTQVFEPANPGPIETCTLWRQTWCAW